MHSHAKTSAEIDGNLIYVAVPFLFLRKSRGEVLKKNCSPGILSTSLDRTRPVASLCGDRASRLVDRFSAGKMLVGLAAQKTS
jgi:hypothetical protein